MKERARTWRAGISQPELLDTEEEAAILAELWPDPKPAAFSAEDGNYQRARRTARRIAAAAREAAEATARGVDANTARQRFEQERQRLVEDYQAAVVERRQQTAARQPAADAALRQRSGGGHRPGRG